MHTTNSNERFVACSTGKGEKIEQTVHNIIWVDIKCSKYFITSILPLFIPLFIPDEALVHALCETDRSLIRVCTVDACMCID